MSLDSYRLTRQYSYSNPRQEMLREKRIQVESLYDLAMDREDNTLLNGNTFEKSPRIFDRKFVDSVHHKITVETICENDWIECGDYLDYDGMVWLCLNSYSFHGLYCRATFMSCDWKIYWTDTNGVLKSQYVIDQNSTQYNSGESGNSTMTLGAAQHMLRMQCNDDTILLDSPQRFAIDKNIKKPTCYKVTQNDNTSYNYGKGLCCVTVAEVQMNTDADKLITLDDGKEVWICDYISPTTPPENDDETTILSDNITGTISGRTDLKLGYQRTYTASLVDGDGNAVEWSDDFSWNIVGDFEVDSSIDGNKITLLVENEDLIDESFALQIVRTTDGSVITEVEITVVGML